MKGQNLKVLILFVDVIITEIFLETVTLTFKQKKKQKVEENLEKDYTIQCVFLSQQSCNQKLNYISNMEYLTHFVGVWCIFDDEEDISLPHFESSE